MKLSAYLYFAHPHGAPSDVGPHLTLVYSPAATGPVEVFVRAAGLAMIASPRTIALTGEVEAFGQGEPVPVAIVDDRDDRIARARLAMLDHIQAAGAAAPSTHPTFRPHMTLVGAVDAAELAGDVVLEGFGVRLTDDDGDVIADHRWPFAASPIAECPLPTTGRIDAPGEGHITGRPARIARVGHVHHRRGGAKRGQALTQQDLADAVTYWNVTGDQVPIDREHLESSPGGRVLALYLVDGGQGIAMLPAYNATRPSMCAKCAGGACPNPLHEPLAEYVARQNGVCWPSPRIIWDQPQCDAATGEVVGRCRIPNVAITTKPGTAHRAVDEVRLAEETPMDELIAALKADSRTPASLIEKLEELQAATVDDRAGGMTQAGKLLIDCLEAAEAAEAGEAETEAAGEAEAEAADESMGGEGGEGSQSEGGAEDQRMEGQEDRRNDAGALIDELVAARYAAQAERQALTAEVAAATSARQAAADERFNTGVEAGRFAEDERALFMHLSQDAGGRKLLETTFLTRKAGHYGTDVRLSETGQRQPRGDVFARIEADRQEGESFNAAMARWEADGKL